MSKPIILKETYKVSSKGIIELIQTDDDKKFSLENNVTKFSSIRYKGEIITDIDEINKII